MKLNFRLADRFLQRN